MRQYTSLHIIHSEVFRNEGILCLQLGLKRFQKIILYRNNVHFMYMCVYTYIHRERERYYLGDLSEEEFCTSSPTSL